MIPNKIQIKGFGPYKEHTEFDFTDKPLTVIFGKNGKGKTFLIESIPACLYGQWPSRGLIHNGLTRDTSIDAYINVEFDFNGDSYVAKRELLDNTHTASLSKNGELIRAGSVKSFYSYIINLLGPEKVFFASVFSSQDSKGDIVDAKPSQRKEILGEILAIDEIESKYEFFRKKLKENKNELITCETKEEAIKGLLGDLKDIEDKDTIAKQIKSAEIEIERLEKQCEDMKRRSEIEGLIKEYKQQIDNLNDRANKVDKLRKQKKQREDVIVENVRIVQQNREFQDQKEVYALHQQSKVLRDEDYNHPPCGTCKLLKGAHAAHRNLVALLKEKGFERYSVGRKEDYEKEPTPLISLPNDNSEELAAALNARSNISRIEKQLYDLDIELSFIPNYWNCACAYPWHFLKCKRDQLETLKQKQYQAEQYSDLSNQLIKLALNKKELDSRTTLYEYLTNAFSKNGIQALLIDRVLPQLESIAEELLLIATDGKWDIEFSTQKQLKSGGVSESLEILCSDEKGQQDIAQFSGGEKAIFKTIIRLTLAIFQAQQAKTKLQFLVIDEGFDSLDAENCEVLLKLLKKSEHYFKRVIFVTHSDEFISHFPHSINLGGE